MKTRIYITLLVLFNYTFAVAQGESEVDLQMNPILAQHANAYPVFKMASLSDTLNLPFKDDFSYNDFYPDTSLWMDNFVFINRDYPIAPPTLGVATFDGLNASGYPYNFSAASNSSAEADFLTSKFIRLGSPVSSADSVYLSFYYQAKGRGNDPEVLDSLILQFYEPLSGWRNVWGRRGYTPSVIDTGFHLVMVPVTDNIYFTNSFRFRFVNHATLSGNLDHWHVDYVYLNSSRHKADTVFNDAAFVYNAPSFLKTYRQMPWRQYISTEKADSVSIFIGNNSSSALNVSYKDTLWDNTPSSPVWTYDGGVCAVSPFVVSGYANCPSHKSPNFNYNFPAFTDSVTFTAVHRINAPGDIYSGNDLLTFKQYFHDYYAYDDGTTESGYGLTVNNSSFAYRLTLNATDTLRAFQIFFNPIQASVLFYPIRFAVWANNSGYPGALIRRDSIVYPVYGSKINEFITYEFDTANPLVLTAGTYFFGWIQHTTNILNVGLDKNTSTAGKAFFNIGSGWQTSSVQGAVMLRPVLGKKFTISGVNESPRINDDNYSIYPNPANRVLNLQSTLAELTRFSLYDSFGRLLVKDVFANTHSLDISSFANGLYLVVFENENGVSVTHKCIISNQ